MSGLSRITLFVGLYLTTEGTIGVATAHEDWDQVKCYLDRFRITKYDPGYGESIAIMWISATSFTKADIDSSEYVLDVLETSDNDD